MFLTELPWDAAILSISFREIFVQSLLNTHFTEVFLYVEVGWPTTTRTPPCNVYAKAGRRFRPYLRTLLKLWVRATTKRRARSFSIRSTWKAVEKRGNTKWIGNLCLTVTYCGRQLNIYCTNKLVYILVHWYSHYSTIAKHAYSAT